MFSMLTARDYRNNLKVKQNTIQVINPILNKCENKKNAKQKNGD